MFKIGSYLGDFTCNINNEWKLSEINNSTIVLMDCPNFFENATWTDVVPPPNIMSFEAIFISLIFFYRKL